MNQTDYSQSHRIAFIKARWHAEIVDKAEDGFRAELTRHGVTEACITTFAAPGAFDIPLIAQKLSRTQRFDAVIACGFVVDGGIYRHDFVAASVIDGLMRVGLDTGVPVLSVVLTPHQFQETEAHETFFKRHFVTKGEEAARACLEILGTLNALPADAKEQAA